MWEGGKGLLRMVVAFVVVLVVVVEAQGRL
jgi:hypothetical protein